MNNKNRDSIDFGKTDIPQLFSKLFVPTLMGLIFSAVFNIADGVIVGHGVGSDALAAVNIAAPIFLIASSFSLMFASGVSIVGAVHLSRGNVKAACINTTQALTVPLVAMVVLAAVMLFCARGMCFLFGGSEKLLPFVSDYLHWLVLYPIFQLIMIEGSFILRLDGSPNYAMMVNVVPSLVNIFLDWLFVFPLKWGLAGAAFATSLSAGLGALLVMVYLLFFSKKIHLYKPKFSATALRLTARNTAYMAKLGFPTFIGEGAITCMMIAGNYMFMRMLGEDGVAAFGTCCYLFPLVFMFANAIAQSQLPIVSYNYGLGDKKRVRSAFKFAVVLAVCCGALMTILGIVASKPLVSLFISTGTNAFRIGAEGFPYFALSFVLFSFNMVVIGFWQSVERVAESVFFMLLRGLVFLVPVFVWLPSVMGVRGLWIAVPLSEVLTCMVIVFVTIRQRRKIYLD